MTYNDLAFRYHLSSHKIFLRLFLLAFVCQIFFWIKTENIKPDFEIVPPAPSKQVIAAALGDKQFLFYALGTRLQNSGDIFAGFAALKRYNYQNLYDWMKRLDELDTQSHLIAALASYYYSQTQNKPDTRYIVDYLDEHVATNPPKKWWWLVQAMYIAKDTLKDKERALELAHKLGKIEGDDIPLWANQMPAMISKEFGDGCDAFLIIKNLIDEGESGKRKIEKKDMDFMYYFINERLRKLKKSGFDANKCLASTNKKSAK
jgi:hypothetical protein